MPVCKRKGCGQDFKEDANSDTSCTHHPGGPVFHEGLKSWSCCSKKVADFEDFLKIPGCSVGRHTSLAPEEPSPTAPVEKAAKPTTVGKTGVETYTNGTNGTALPNPAAETFQAKAKTPADAAPAVKEEDLHDSPDAKVAEGTKCKRNACGKTWAGEGSRTEECVFHSGQPIFHEGSKGWSCCSRKVLEFDEFLKIKGCKRAKHRFTDVDNSQPQEIQCRHDWYQTPSTVILSVFAKKVDKEATSITFTSSELRMNIKFQDGKTSTFNTALSQPIDPAGSKYEVLSTKIEVVLKKVNALSWATLEPNEKVVSWTTFGTFGRGTIGGKTPDIAGDIDIALLPK
ncbi:chord-domain-containing protein [Fimicolochytrium jonesii]|uniref:chord-domain-containing protein n=1 Tax=Fimicolochytrium jonesii TaxID=1396493 RepID=UPI0022FE1D7A|nr:chord-domain-containing protein [Fimicolochytrium jonesii]KAI8821412.1 chord-domain-containing protein [Fimicolochytrium jonesii]